MKIERTMKVDKVTKGAIRYGLEGDDNTMSSMYLRKDDLPTPWPETITVTVEYEDK